MKTIRLTQRQWAKVDDDDFDALNQFSWFAYWSPCTKSFYAVRNIVVDPARKVRRLLPMHRKILGLGYMDKKQVDHFDHHTLNNVRSNLRIVSNRENHENMRNQSQHGVGVYKKNNRPSYCARILVGVKRIHLGAFPTAEDAQIARAEFLSEHP